MLEMLPVFVSACVCFMLIRQCKDQHEFLTNRMGGGMILAGPHNFIIQFQGEGFSYYIVVVILF